MANKINLVGINDQLPKLKVAGSNPVARFFKIQKKSQKNQKVKK